MDAASRDRLAHDEFDLLVVGGGITGAGVARDAATRGLNVALIEAGDFAQATSSASSRLIHGGIRYLQYGDFGLVFEALTERRNLLRAAPHLCRPVEFVFPAYVGQRPSLWQLTAGVALYNALALWRPPVAGRRVGREELSQLAPLLSQEALRGAVIYTDCQTDDARLVLENVLDAIRAGAVALSRVRATKLLKGRHGRVRGVLVEERGLDGEPLATMEVRARVVVNATGPFSDSFSDGNARPLLRPTKGVHLVLSASRLPLGDRAFVLRSPRDGRIMFALPSGRRSVIGTTDTDWASPEGASPRVGDLVVATRQDVDYLLEAANHAFPEAMLGPDDVISTYAGLRPLVAEREASASATSREHLLQRDPNGLISIVGGKLTTFRRMAEETVDKVVETLRDHGFERPIGPCETEHRPLPGAGKAHRFSLVELAPQVQSHLELTYGSRAASFELLLAETSSRVRLSSRLDPELPYVWAEVLFAVRHEHARDLEDVLVRRLSYSRDAADGGIGISSLASEIVGDELGWSPQEKSAAVDRFRRVVEERESWRNEPALSSSAAVKAAE